MSSIRPLATITVLALVGVLLYMKINETEPPLPEGVEDWAADTNIQFDMGGTDPAAAPQFGMSSESTEAPAYSAPSTSGTAAPPYVPEASAAPSWSGPPTGSAPPPAVDQSPAFDSTSNASSGAAPEFPELPPLPESPPSYSSAPAVGAADGSTPADVPAGNAANSPASETPVASASPVSEAATVADVTPTPTGDAGQAQSSLFSATQLAVQAALDRGELSQALLLLSEWYDDPSLSPSESKEVNTLLSQLAGSVIYSTEPRLEPPYMVQAGERLETIAKKYEVPWQLLAKINGITSADQLQPGQQLKVVRGPFSALIDISQRTMTLMLDRRYAGRFSLDIDPSVTVEAGHWEVNQKLLTPANANLPGTGSSTATEERSLMLSNTNEAATTQVAILRGTIATDPLSTPAGRVLRMKPRDAEDVFDILSLGSKVVIRR